MYIYVTNVHLLVNVRDSQRIRLSFNVSVTNLSD